MKSLMLTAIGELQVVDVPDPTITAPDHVLVKVAAAGICGSDLHGYTGRTGRRKPPLIMGHEASGVVVKTGNDVPDALLGARVAIQPLISTPGGRRLLGMDEPGAYAEFVACPASNVRRLPDSMAMTKAAMAEPVAVAVHAVDRVGARNGAPTLVVGGGPIGLLVAQVARARGWGPILVSDPVEARRAVAAELGFVPVDSADHDQVRRLVAEHTEGQGVELAFEAVGVGAAVAQAHASVKRGGVVLWVGNNAKQIEVDMQDVVTRELTVHGSYGLNIEDFEAALVLIGEGTVEVGPLLSRFAALDEGPEVFEELLATPELLKGMFVLDS